jgi:hypothetical protein
MIRFQAAHIPQEELSATFTPGWLKEEEAEGIGQRVLSRLRRIK